MLRQYSYNMLIKPPKSNNNTIKAICWSHIRAILISRHNETNLLLQHNSWYQTTKEYLINRWFGAYAIVKGMPFLQSDAAVTSRTRARYTERSNRSHRGVPPPQRAPPWWTGRPDLANSGRPRQGDAMHPRPRLLTHQGAKEGRCALTFSHHLRALMQSPDGFTGAPCAWALERPAACRSMRC